MTSDASAAVDEHSLPRRFPLYYGWINVLMAAIAMSLTLPGRTHGLGLITKPLLDDLSLAETLFSRINLISSLAGALFCIPIGALLDRFGTRGVLTAVVVALGGSVMLMSHVSGPVSLCLALILVRGFGQSALSIVSMAIIGKWFRRRLGTAMGVFSVLLTFGFIGGILGLGAAVDGADWRGAWNGLGLIVLAFAPLGWLAVRSTPQSAGLDEQIEFAPLAQTREAEASPCGEASLPDALRTPAFWILVLGTSAFNLVWSSVMLFNELILAQKGFDKDVSVAIMAALTGCGLIANLIGGKLATRTRIAPLLGAGLAILAIGLGAFPGIQTRGALYGYGIAMGVAGGIVTVVFFAAWGHVFGRSHLGRIQGAAQLVSVLASAIGPVLMAECHARTGSYLAMFHGLAWLCGGLSLAAFAVPVPRFSEKQEHRAAPTRAKSAEPYPIRE